MEDTRNDLSLSTTSNDDALSSLPPQSSSKSDFNRAGGEPPSFVTAIPEVVKLIAASLFVAIILHHFFFREKRSSMTSRRSGGESSASISARHVARHGDHLRGGGSSDKGYILGSGDASLEKEDVDADNDGEPSDESVPKQSRKQQVTDDDMKIGKKKLNKVKQLSAKNEKASMKRNYDKLICDKGPKSNEEDDLDDSERTGAVVIKPSTLAQASNSRPVSSSETQLQQHQQKPQKLHSQAKHPGLSSYYNWHATTTSLYRIYAIPSRDTRTNTFHPAILPMHPSSERGKTSIHITVVNQTRYEAIQVYWIDFRGNEVYKGSILRGGTWVQTTFIGHPWTFRVGGTGAEEENVLLKYVPFRIVPTVIGAKTTTSWEEDVVVGSSSSFSSNPVGTQMFTLRDAPEGYVTRNEGYEPFCWVDDTILPEPPLIDTYNGDRMNLSLFTIREMKMAIHWSCLQIQREDAVRPGTGVVTCKRLLQYLKNICLEPQNTKYRRLRTSNRIFFESIYSTGARGVLLALGFEEWMGYLECGPSGDEGDSLNYERLRQISDAMMVVDQTLKVLMASDAVVLSQPDGVDGYGRAGFGHAGGMNF